MATLRKNLLIIILVLGSVMSVLGQTVTIGTATTTTGYNPVYTFYGYNYTQQIYTAAEITAGGGAAGMQINAIRFYWSGAGDINNTNAWTVYLGNTATATFANTTSWIPLASLTSVYSGAVALPGSAGWMTITLTTPYIWNGNNLVVAIDENVPSYGSSSTTWHYTTTSSNYRAIYYYSDGTNPDPASPPSGTITYNRPNIQLEMVSLIPCSGQPADGLVAISAATGCPATPFGLSVTGMTVGSGITYQWQSSASATGPWTNITGATSTNYSVGANSVTYYQLFTTCVNSGMSATSNVVSYTPVGNVCECGAYPANYPSYTGDEDISNVTVGTMSNSSTCATTAPGTGSILNRYSNYTGFVAAPSFLTGQVINFSLTQTSCGSSYGNGFQIYIDYNQDGDFLDAGEQVYNQPVAATGNHTKTGSFTVPVAATLGITRMRIINIETSFPTSTNYTSTTFGYGEVEDYCVTIVAASNCAGTPDNGVATISAATGCPSTAFVLNATDVSIGYGMSYQWQSSASASGPWTNITGATSTNYSVGASVITYYQLLSNCLNSGLSATSNVVSYTPVGNVCECGAYPAIYPSSTADEDISNVTVGTMSNSSTCASVGPGTGSILNRYSNYAGFVAAPSFLTGQVINFSLTQTSCGSSYGNGFQIYIDYNQDGDFMDAGEQVYNQPVAATGNHTKTGSFTIPVAATLGTTRMRITNTEASFPTGTNYSSTAFSYGEVEDYCVTIVAATNCAGTPNNGIAAISATTGCPATPFSLNATDVSIGYGISYQWQSSASASGPWTNITGATSTNYSVGTNSVTYYQLLTNCLNSGLSATSNVVSYTPVGNVCECGAYPAIYPSSTADEDISNVTVGTMSNSSTCASVGPGTGSILNRYSNYAGFVVGPTVQTGQIVNFSLTQTSCGSSYGNGFQMYIDYNQDGDFMDAGEQVYNQPVAANGNHTKTGTFTIPLSATLGITRMRITNTETTFPTATNYTSSTFSYGEVEDYCITIIAATACSATPVGGSASPATQQVPTGTTANLSLTGSTVASGLTYQWQSSTSASGPFTNITGATSINLTTPTLSVNTYFRCIVTCTASAESAISAVGEVQVVNTVNMMNGSVTTCGSLFYDSGGATGNYAGNENYTLTIYPDVVGNSVRVTFTSFNVENTYENLKIYNGNSTAAPLFGNYTGTTVPPVTTSTAADGSLTFVFTSDGSVFYAGWVANLSCYSNCVYFTPAFTPQGPYCATATIPSLPTTSNDGVTGVWSPAINNTATTTYTFTPAPNQCALNATMTITINPNTPALFTPYTSYCPGAVIPDLPLTSDDGITGTWSPAIDNTIPTTYTFVPDGGVCALADLTIVIDTFPHPITNNSGTTELTCLMTYISLTATGGATYTWTGGPPSVLASLAVNAPGTYTVTVNSSNGCSDTESITITQNITPPSITITNNTGEDEFNCSVALISLTATGGATYNWNGGNTPTQATNSFTSAGTYTVTVTGTNGCTAAETYVLTQAQALDITEIITNASCFGYEGAAEIVVNSGGLAPFTILWQDGSTNFINSNVPASTNFGYTITGADLCTTAEKVFINDPDLLVVTPVSNDLSCFGYSDGVVDASNTTGGTTPYGYLWSNNATSVLVGGLQPGNYSVTVTDFNGCSTSENVTVISPIQISVTLTKADGICGANGGSISASVTGGVGGYTYLWSSGANSNLVSNLVPGNYILTVSDANLCTTSVSSTIVANGNIMADVVIVQPVTCSGLPDATIQAASVNGVPPLDILWNGGLIDPILNNLGPGDYYVTITDAWGCKGYAQTTLTAPDYIVLDYHVTDITCFGINNGKINIGLSGGDPPFTIMWSNGTSGTSINSLAPGQYSVTVNDTRDCVATQNFELVQPEPMNLTFTKEDISCYGASDGLISLTVSGGQDPYYYSISSGQFTANTSSTSSLPAGNYTLSVRDNNNCTATSSVSIYQPAALDASVLASNPSCIGNNDGYIAVSAYGGTEPYVYIFDNMQMDTSVYSRLREGTYEIGIKDASDCDYKIGKIRLNEALYNCLEIPTAFTPNGDGVNDTWQIRNIGMFPGVYVHVFNRWGQEIYTGRVDSEPWDGTYNGKPVSAGAYLFVIDPNNETEHYKGTLTVIY